MPWGRAVGVLVALLAAAACQARPAPVLRIAQNLTAVTLDPHRHDNLMTHSALSHFYEGLVGFGPDMQIVPALAERWESPADALWRFHLRPGVRFHDERVLSAADVVASLERARAPDSSIAYHLEGISAARAVDPLTVEIRTAGSQPGLLGHLAFVAIVPAGTPPAEITHPVGTGPYRLVSGTAGGTLRGERFPRHWDGDHAEAPARVEILGLPDPRARARAVVDGQADVVAQFPPEQWAWAAGQEGMRAVSRPSLSVLLLGFSLDPPSPFAAASLREAVSLAMSREALVARGLDGLGRPLHQLVPSDVIGYAIGLGPMEADPARARQLVGREGLTCGLRVSDTLAPVGRELVRQLAEVGVTARLEVVPQREFFERWRHDPAPLTLFAYSAATGDALSALDPLVHTASGRQGTFNSFGYANPELDRLIEAAAGEAPGPARQARLERAAAMVRRDLPVVPLAQRLELYAVRRDLSWTPRLDRYVRAIDFRSSPR